MLTLKVKSYLAVKAERAMISHKRFTDLSFFSDDNVEGAESALAGEASAGAGFLQKAAMPFCHVGVGWGL